MKKSRRGELAGEFRYGGRLWALNWMHTGKCWSSHGCLMIQVHEHGWSRGCVKAVVRGVCGLED